MRIFAAISLAVACGLCGCAQSAKDVTESWPVDRLYNEAKAALNRKNYDKAKEYYRVLETRFPFGVYGQQALLDLAYAYYKTEDPDNAIETCERFIKLHPQHAHVDYVYYLRGLADFYRSGGLAQRFMNLDSSQRDPATNLRAFERFSELVRRFPDSRYAPDARQRMVYLRNILAEHEVETAHYYLRRGAYLAAANRARYVVEHYARTPSVSEALAVMARAYRVLGLDELSTDALRVLRLNHPEHPDIREVERIRVR